VAWHGISDPRRKDKKHAGHRVSRPMRVFGEEILVESLILAQDQRWRRA
jgi:hypothetical protein